MKKKITIAVDGHSSCGKSTLAKDIAKKMGYLYIDSGAMYRAITLFAIRKNLNENTFQEIIPLLNEINLSFQKTNNGSSSIYLNGENVEDEIRRKPVANAVSKIAKIKEVRKKLVIEQRKFGKNGGIVMDGRDIGSVVFPNAELKLFITADVDIRTNRRYLEMIQKGVSLSKEEVKKNLVERDHIDSTREESPLVKVKDAVEINNSNLSKKEQLNLVLKIIEKTISNLS